MKRGGLKRDILDVRWVPFKFELKEEDGRDNTCPPLSIGYEILIQKEMEFLKAYIGDVMRTEKLDIKFSNIEAKMVPPMSKLHALQRKC